MTHLRESYLQKLSSVVPEKLTFVDFLENLPTTKRGELPEGICHQQELRVRAKSILEEASKLGQLNKQAVRLVSEGRQSQKTVELIKRTLDSKSYSILKAYLDNKQPSRTYCLPYCTGRLKPVTTCLGGRFCLYNGIYHSGCVGSSTQQRAAAYCRSCEKRQVNHNEMLQKLSTIVMSCTLENLGDALVTLQLYESRLL